MNETPSPPAVRAVGLDHIVLRVADVERSIAFYTAVLGARPERVDEWRRGGAPFPSVRLSPTAIIDLFPRDAGRPAEGGLLDHVCVEVDEEDMSAAAARLRERGVTVESDPGTRWGARGDGTSVYVRDPDGLVVELKRYGG